MEADYALELVRDGAEFSLYRGTERSSGLPVLVVAIAGEQVPPQSIRKLQNEYALSAELANVAAARPLALKRHQGRPILVLADPGGDPLDRLIERQGGSPIDLTRFLRIAVRLAASLDKVHRQGLIHKDIKPANALVSDTDEVHLTGFGVASKVPRERIVAVASQTFAGTLAYMSPEQTGRMNRSMDSRSDLYSLGVTLYELLTGTLPFTADDPLEWVHCHIARMPVTPVERRSVPAPLSAIIMRLLAKNAEERYQTAAGLESDLRRCLSDWRSFNDVGSFPLGTNDLSDRLSITEKLYGRQQAVEALLAAADHVFSTGVSELVMVSGYSGVGKSSLVNELQKALVPSRTLFATGKFDQHKRDVPYATLTLALQMLVRHVLIKTDAELERWRDEIVSALGSSGQLMVNLVPELEFVIGAQAPPPDLPLQEARGRFQLAFKRFLGVFATRDHPLVLFLDDLQWIDPASLDLLVRTVIDPEARYLLLVGAYRDNEVAPSDPLMRSLAAIAAAGAKAQNIVLAPLRPDELEQFVADALRCGRETVAPLSRLLHEKTGGNPFFATQLLSALVDEELLRFDRDIASWRWDVEQIRGKRYTDSVVTLMMGRLRTLSERAQLAIQELACLGNSAEIDILSAAFSKAEKEIDASLLEASRAGLIFRSGRSFEFLHDRIQEVAYELLADDARVATHLRVGRTLLGSLSEAVLDEHLFDVANQFKRGAELLSDQDEKGVVADLHLRAGRKAKESAAYASAREHFSAGVALLGPEDWSRRYALTFSLSLEAAESAFLCGALEEAEHQARQLLSRAASTLDEAKVYHLIVQLYVINSQSQRAVDAGRECLRKFGIEMPTNPGRAQVRVEYESLLETLDRQPLESLAELPLMTDPELLAAMPVLSVILAPAYFVDFDGFCALELQLVKLSIRHGITSALTHAYATLTHVLGPVFHRHDLGYGFAKLACELVEKHGFVADKTKVYNVMGLAAFWSQPISVAIDSLRTGTRAAIETGDPTYACLGMTRTIPSLLLKNDPLDVVRQEADIALDFARKAGFTDAATLMEGHLYFIDTMQGRTASFSTFDDAGFDESAFEARLTADRMRPYWWVLKLEARFLAGDYVSAWATARVAKALVPGVCAFVYSYYTALTVSALYPSGSAQERQSWRVLLAAHEEELSEWARNNPQTFADKHALVAAEIARLEDRAVDALRLYEDAIRLARQNGFDQNEGLAHELAAQHCLALGLETAAHAHLRGARNGYDRWGASAKVRQLDERYHSSLAQGPSAVSVGQVDVEAVVRASRALSSEIVLPRLVEQIMLVAIAHAGAERGLLILKDGEQLRIEAEAATEAGIVIVTCQPVAIRPTDLPQSVLRYAVQTRQRVLLDDASSDATYSTDDYVMTKGPRSVLCLPIMKQAKLVGALYLENSIARGAFTVDRVAILELLASQAAISLENAVLYSELERSETFLAQGQEISHTGNFGWGAAGTEFHWSDELYDIYECGREVVPTAALALQRVHPDDHAEVQRLLDDAMREGLGYESDHRLLMSDGRIKHVHASGRAVSAGRLDFVCAIQDVTQRVEDAEALRRVQGDLAHVARVATLNAMTASIAHEVSQPLAGILVNASTGVRMLTTVPPDLNGATETARRIIRDANRASAVIERLRTMFSNRSPTIELVDLNNATKEVVALTAGELHRVKVHLQTDFAIDLPPVRADRVQLQQVVLNLLLNAADAMEAVDDRSRTIFAKTDVDPDGQVRMIVRDSGVGLDLANVDKLFELFYTTKSKGMGVGLSICRLIVESCGGRLWAQANDGPGATFAFAIPAASIGPAPQRPVTGPRCPTDEGS